MTQNVELDNFVSTKTRVEVLTEIAEAFAQGWRPGSIHGYIGSTRDNAISKTREEVRSEIAEAYAHGWKPGSLHGYIGSASVSAPKSLDSAS